MDMVRVSALKLRWVVLHLIACALLHSVGAYGNPLRIGPHLNDVIGAQVTSGSDASFSEGGLSWGVEDERLDEYFSRRYFYEHNETQIAMARAEAELVRRQGSGGAASSLRLGRFPDFPPSENGCNWDSANVDLSFSNTDMIHMDIEILAVDSCASGRNLYLTYGSALEYCSQRWVKPDALIRDNYPDPLTRSFNVLVKIVASPSHREEYHEVLGDGVYFPATGQMHLVGCTRKASRANYSDMMNSSYEAPAVLPPISETLFLLEHIPWVNPDTHRAPPLNSSTPNDCAISVTVQYPPLNCRWNWDRVLKYSIRSKRERDDPLYFDPIEGSAFNPYLRRYYTYQMDGIELQRGLETGGRIVLLVLGLVCVALQIEHGRHNEESLPFVSLAMLGILLANHVSQTSIFKDFQIGRYTRSTYRRYLSNGTYTSTYTDGGFRFPGSEDKYYATMAWSEHVPYQAMAMVAIFMYVWIFHRVGDRRRIMKVRVMRKRPGAKDPPSEWRVVYATLAFLSLLCFLGIFAIRADQYGHLRRALSGMTADEDRYFNTRRVSKVAMYPSSSPYRNESPFVSWRFYELSQAQWGFVNKLTGLVVSFFLVPQVVGNMQWDVQGRPLSLWFYMGIPLLQSLPHTFSIAKYFQLLPIFTFYDPYINSIYGIYENPTPWWAIGVVLCSTLQVIAVHSQFSRSRILGTSRLSRPRDHSAVHMADNML